MSDPISDLPFAVLRRLRTSDQGTFGFLRLSESRLLVGELPWRDNDLALSCIPPGRYRCEPVESESRGAHFRLDVPGRTRILIHAGDWCGDAYKGLPTSTHGSLLPGLEVADLNGTLAMRDSRKALHSLTCYAPNGLVLFIVDGTTGQWAGGRWPAESERLGVLEAPAPLIAPPGGPWA